MTTRIPIDLEKSYRLLNHGPTVLVSSHHAGKDNVMAAAWSMPLDFKPPKVAVVIDKNTLTRKLVEASGEFALNVPTRELAKLTVDVGSVSGREVDKFAAYGAATFQGEQVAAPLLEGCIAWLECRLIPEPHIQDTYDLFLGEVVAPGPIRPPSATATGTRSRAAARASITWPAGTFSRRARPSRSRTSRHVQTVWDMSFCSRTHTFDEEQVICSNKV